ncbi:MULTISPECIES: DUF3549 family protein [Gammaproteobacteria]|uniref:DUF3549 family protein n=1 Tax=Gammaproteobacteria TaxID=1236 RepID=UPI000DD08970|nr:MULTISPECIES: DUF3549 family protein [Gammaproteobacteria]RTE86987.1 DUF3549 family protein [Aliidiomarina sp. B3213]TCZ93223.1 DUF3549 family protein [Lysobacter sp. N42]
MSQISTLSEFMNASGCRWCAYDLSRQVRALSPALIEEVETGRQPFPTPRQQKAWLALVFWQSIDKPYIWFASLPLDERGGFQQAAMQHFMSIIVEALGSDLTQDPTKEQEALLEQNPYIFTPDMNKRAAFHAQFTRDFDLNASIHFESADAFFSGNSDIDWQQLGVQGIHDVIQRKLENSSVQQTLNLNLLEWPEPLQQAVCQAIEHAQLPSSLADNLIGKAQSNESSRVNPVLLQAMASVANRKGVEQFVLKTLQQSEGETRTQILIIIAARLWQALAKPEVFQNYFEVLATDSEEVFQSLFKELVTLPSLRMNCLQLLNSPQQNEQLQQQIVKLITNMKGRS